jgi:hypothetical protein
MCYVAAGQCSSIVQFGRKISENFSNWVGGIRSGSFRLKSLMRSCMIELSVLLRSCSIETTDNIAYLLCLARCKLKGKLVSMNAHHNYDAICFPDDFFFQRPPTGARFHYQRITEHISFPNDGYGWYCLWPL